jgi:hypothetical protein
MISISPAAEYMSEMALWKEKNEAENGPFSLNFQNGYAFARVASDTT